MLGFRVWDSLKEKFLDDTLYFFTLTCYGKLLLDEEDLKIFIPMQSTGITDFLGKEIFEGDVLFIYYHDPAFTNEYYMVNNVRDFLLYYGARMLVISKISNDGNIYENPDLLKRL